ncbi:MAG: MFS transporter [Pseudomonadota bacterium]|nr:MFS transporter [Pseudomonadota bacterium]
MTADARPLPLFLSRRFFPLWVAVCESAFTDNMLRQALIIAIVYGAVSAGFFKDPTDAIPVMGALFSAATLLCTSAAGQVAEKFETGRLLKRIKLVEVALMLVAAIGFALQSGTLLMAVFIGFSAQVAFFNPVRIVALPKYLHAEELVRGNAFCSAGLFVSVVLGLYLGGVLIDTPMGPLIVSTCLVAAAATAFAAVLALPEAPPDAPALKIDWNPVGQTLRILRFAFSETGVWRPLAGVAFFYVVSTVTTILVPLYAIEELGADGPAATSIMGVFAIGAGVGAIAAALISKHRSGLGFSFVGVVGASAMTATVYWLTDIVAASGASATVPQLLSHTPGALLLLGFSLCSGFMGLYLVPLQAAAQRRAPPGKRARILAAGNILNAICAMIGSLCVLVITNTKLSPADGLLMLAIMQLAVGLYMALRFFALPQGFHDDMLLARGEPAASTYRGA